jgi:hypothetical protein
MDTEIITGLCFLTIRRDVLLITCTNIVSETSWFRQELRRCCRASEIVIGELCTVIAGASWDASTNNSENNSACRRKVRKPWSELLWLTKLRKKM